MVSLPEVVVEAVVVLSRTILPYLREETTTSSGFARTLHRGVIKFMTCQEVITKSVPPSSERIALSSSEKDVQNFNITKSEQVFLSCPVIAPSTQTSISHIILTRTKQ